MAKAFVRPRPVRVVFLVEENENWQPMMQAIFANCYRRWGGRFNLIVPCVDGQIRPAYQPWLEAYDPDIIYSYLEFEDEGIRRLHERYYPAFLVRHNFFARTERDFAAFSPHLPIEALTSVSGTFIASRGNMLSRPQPVTIVDFYGRGYPPQFLQENFGFYHGSLFPWPIPRHLAEYVQSVSFVEKEYANERFTPRPEGEFFTDYHEFLDHLAEDRNISGLALLSAWMCPRLQLRDPRWENRVNLFVGDSFADRITFWNARSHLGVYLDPTLVTLKMSPADIDDDRTFAAIIKIIRKRIHVSHSGNHSHITIRSASHTDQELDRFVERFRGTDRWNSYSRERVDTIDQCCPDRNVLASSMHHVEDGAPFRVSDWHEILFNDGFFRPPVITPRHIRDAPALPFDLTRGAWALDLDIERTADHSRFQNVQHRWILPRRLRMARAFCQAYSLGGLSNALCVPRVTGGGLLSLMCSFDGQLPELKVPDDEHAFMYALSAPRDWIPFAAGQGPLQNSLFYDTRSSDKVRYLTALNHLSGGIHSSRGIFLNKFWKQQFEMLGASTRMGKDRVPELIRLLQKRIKSGRIEGKEEWQRIAGVVLAEARSIRLGPRFLRFDYLSEQFEGFRNAYWETNQAGAPREEWDEWEKQSLGRSVQFLCEREILHQGYEWLCPRCNNTNWVGIDALRKFMVCDVCGQSKVAPVTAPWNFKLNAFVLEGLRAHGLLAELWCLSRLSDRARGSFYFLEPHELFFIPPVTPNARPDAEIDLIAVVDGIVHLCEAKTSNHVDVEKFAELALKIRPDVATLAIMEPHSQAVDRRLNELKRLLEGSDIAAEVLWLGENDIEDSPNLPTGSTQLIRLL